MDLVESVIGPVEVIHQIRAEAGAAGGVKQCFSDLSCNAFATDGDVGVAVRILYDFGLKWREAHLLGSEMVAGAVELSGPLLVLVALDMLVLEC